jgi:hypothetical protein
MTKRKLSEEANNLKLPDLNTFNISSEISESSDYILFVRNQQDDEKSKTLEAALARRKKSNR